MPQRQREVIKKKKILTRVTKEKKQWRMIITYIQNGHVTMREREIIQLLLEANFSSAYNTSSTICLTN